MNITSNIHYALLTTLIFTTIMDSRYHAIATIRDNFVNKKEHGEIFSDACLDSEVQWTVTIKQIHP